MTKVQHPIVVIGIPVYNESRYIKETLDSVAQQTWTDFRVLISDNASTDDTGLICQQYCDKDSRFVYVCHDQNKGSTFNFQYLLDSTESPYFMWLGGHDLLHPEFLNKHISRMESDESISLSCSHIQWINEESIKCRETKLASLTQIKGTSIIRYLKTVISIEDADSIAINQLIRRTHLTNLKLGEAIMSDHIVISRLNFLGRISLVNEHLYIARGFDKPRDQSWMERVNPDNPSVCLDRKLLKQSYLDDFDKIDDNRRVMLGHQLLRFALIYCIYFRLLKLDYTYQPNQLERVEPFYVFIFYQLVTRSYGRVKRVIKNKG